jgi:DNA-binding NtrC family response regulator
MVAPFAAWALGTLLQAYTGKGAREILDPDNQGRRKNALSAAIDLFDNGGASCRGQTGRRWPVARILLIDDDRDFSEELSKQLRQLGHEAVCCDLAEEGLGLLASGDKIDLLLLDNRMSPMSGLEFLAAGLERGILVRGAPDRGGVRPAVVLMTGAHTDQTAIQAVTLGAFDYVIKPDDFADILRVFKPVLNEALQFTLPLPNVKIHESDGKESDDDSLIVGHSNSMLKVLKDIARLAGNDKPVLILGETGTGKDLVARAIHTNSPRKNKSFVPINCTALSDNLLDDELFGHVPGAFTGADKLRKGRFEHAHGGTLFLDEVGDMPPNLQAKLLRVLQNKEVVRLGSNDPIVVDVRILAATHRNLKQMIAEGKFREDLYYRLDSRTIRLPPLRQRQEDIEFLARRILRREYAGSSSVPTLHPAALEALRNHPWPGNIRELENVLSRTVDGCSGSQIMRADLDFGEPAAISESVSEERALAGLRQAVAWAWESGQPNLWPLLQQRLEAELLRYALAQPGVNQVQLANKLGMARNTLRARLEQYGLD